MSSAESQINGPIGKIVDGMIRRSVRKNFHNVWWLPPKQVLPETCVFVPNHHGWYDGYLMYHAVTKLECMTLDWIAEFDAFPLFRFVGGMPFPVNDATTRATTIRKTVRALRNQRANLLLFAEGVLHRPPEVLKFGKSLELICSKVPNAHVVPVAIRYEMSLHERPEAFLVFGDPLPASTCRPEEVRLRVKGLLDFAATKISVDRTAFSLLAPGTKDVNERWDMRRLTAPKRQG
jgi:1-acyl-sn-glycerol-3-phosphate acyltransferase